MLLEGREVPGTLRAEGEIGLEEVAGRDGTDGGQGCALFFEPSWCCLLSSSASAFSGLHLTVTPTVLPSLLTACSILSHSVKANAGCFADCRCIVSFRGGIQGYRDKNWLSYFRPCFKFSFHSFKSF